MEELKGLKRHQFASTETTDAARPYEKMALAGKKVRYQNVIRNEQGVSKHLDIEFVPHLDPISGKLKGAVVVGHDVTALQEARRQAELSRKALYDLFMEAPVGICVFEGSDHRFVLVNPIFKQIFSTTSAPFSENPSAMSSRKHRIRDISTCSITFTRLANRYSVPKPLRKFAS
ncbi:MAG: hypothetical protein H7301_09505 [Cryobacterium sp.]|nr:hypothetical protein [Oligoflexia bacterium]